MPTYINYMLNGFFFAASLGIHVWNSGADVRLYNILVALFSQNFLLVDRILCFHMDVVFFLLSIIQENVPL